MSQMKTITVEIEGRLVEGVATLANGLVWAHLDGETFTYEAPKSGRERRARGAGGASGQPGEIAAPMPGKIIKLLVKPGEAVTAGQVLLVMEAMKMEYTLKAPADGVVGDILCQANDQVALGQLLVKVADKG